MQLVAADVDVKLLEEFENVLERSVPAGVVVGAERVLYLVKKRLPPLLVRHLEGSLYDVVGIPVHQQVLYCQLLLLLAERLLAHSIWQVNDFIEDLKQLTAVREVLLIDLDNHADGVLDQLAAIFLDGHHGSVSLDEV